MQVEIRADKKSMAVRGYVNVVDRDSRVLHDRGGPYIERIAPGTFAKALASGSPVELRWNHRKVLGSTEDGLALKEDNIGLKADSVVQDAEVIAAAEKKELRGWSFGFVKKADQWSTDDKGMRHRTVTELELREVSILNKTPAYIATSIETRGEEELLVEYRMDEPADDVDYVSETERNSAESVKRKTATKTEETENEMFLVSKTIEIMKMKRRMPNAY